MMGKVWRPGFCKSRLQNLPRSWRTFLKPTRHLDGLWLYMDFIWRLCGRPLYKIFKWLDQWRHYGLDFTCLLVYWRRGKLYGDALCKMVVAWIWYGEIFVSFSKVH